MPWQEAALDPRGGTKGGGGDLPPPSDDVVVPVLMSCGEDPLVVAALVGLFFDLVMELESFLLNNLAEARRRSARLTRAADEPE